MSGKATGIVWESDLPRPEKYVLLALADHAKEDGSDVYPSLWKIQWMTSYSETQVRGIMRRLIELKILVKVHQGGKRDGDTNRYKIDYKAIAVLKDFKEWSAEKRANEKKNKSTETVPSSTETAPSPEGTVSGCGGYGLTPDEGTVATAPKRTNLERKNIEQDLGNEASSLPPPIDLPPVELQPQPGFELQSPQETQPEKPKVQDLRFAEVCDAIRKCWPKGEGYKCDITPADAGALNRMLAKNHAWKPEELAVCIVARFMSGNVNPTESVKAWIGAISDYQSGPQDKYGGPKYAGAELNQWRNEARTILYGPQPEQMALHAAPLPSDFVPDKELWFQVLLGLQGSVARQSYDTWLKPTRGIGRRGDRYFVQIPSREFANIGSKFGDLVSEEIKGAGVTAVTFVTGEDFAQAVSA